MRVVKVALVASVLAVLAALASSGCAQPAGPSPADKHALTEGHDALQIDAAAEGTHWLPGVHDIRLAVEGQDATGLLAIPEGRPTALVVVAHGWGGNAAFHRPDLERIVQAGAIGLAMDYRGPPSAFKVRTGVADTVAATVLVQQAYPSLERTMLYGWSMGAEVALLAPLEAPPETYDYVFAGAGVMDLGLLWSQNPIARLAIEDEAGAAPLDDPAPYVERSPAARAAALATRGLARVFLLHGEADSVVGIDHAERMYEELATAGVPVSYYVVARDRSVACDNAGCREVAGPGDHWAGRLELMWPFVLNRLAGAADPSEPAVRGTYDAYAGTYEPTDTHP
jgi:pimeloyl-ACP methyl ester carboxylesterase